MSQTNKSLHKKLDSKLKESYLHPGLLLFNPCNLHKCDNAFHKSITIYGKDSENLTFELHAWIKVSPCKREDFLQVVFELQSMEYFSKSKTLCQRNIFLSISQNKKVLKRVLLITKDVNEFQRYSKEKTSFLFR